MKLKYISKYLKNKINFYCFTLIPLITLSLIGCNIFNEECEERPIGIECEHQRPTHGILNISVTINSENPSVPVNVYRGDFESGILILSDTLNINEVEYILPINEYSATAKYISGQDTIITVDGGEISAELTEYCGEYCWEVHDADFDLEL
jgi:hypothetical protein